MSTPFLYELGGRVYVVTKVRSQAPLVADDVAGYAPSPRRFVVDEEFDITDDFDAIVAARARP